MLTPLKKIFTWWNQDTLGTRIKTILFGKFAGTDSFGNKYYESKSGKRWVIYSGNIEATKISSDWYLWIHHTIDKIPSENDLKKYSWQKEHSENKTETDGRHQPVKIKKDENQFSNSFFDLTIIYGLKGYRFYRTVIY